MKTSYKSGFYRSIDTETTVYYNAENNTITYLKDSFYRVSNEVQENCRPVDSFWTLIDISHDMGVE